MIRVVLGDDHAIMRQGVKQLLGDCLDITVVGEAANGHEVLEQVRAQDFDVLVLDMSMPGRSGVELIKAIKAEKKRLHILVLSMHKEEQYAVRAIKAGAAGYLTKENAVDKLVEAIRKVASGGIYISMSVAERLAQESSQGDATTHASLSDREYQVFDMLVDGRSVSEIALALHVSVKTVSTHKARIQQKLGAASTADLVHYAIRHGLKDPQSP